MSTAGQGGTSQMVLVVKKTKQNKTRSLGWEDLLEEGMATHSSILAWRISMDREAWRGGRGG